MTSIEIAAPAKVNLVLKVLNKRKDSYHDLHTLFERISLSDKITISRMKKGIIVTCDKPVTRKASDNIVYKAAELILKTAKIDSGLKIDIKKRIPIAAGLGGGSSDAASTLIGINKLFNIGMSRERLVRLGSMLGADVPFFIYDTPYAVGKGIGDKLNKVNSRLKLFHILIYPGFKLATKDVYARVGGESELGLTRKRPDAKITIPKDWDSLESLMRNDLEDAAVQVRPIIGRIIRCLATSLGRRFMVSGSGPSVFCLYKTRKEAVKARRKLLKNVPERFRKRWRIFIVETEV